MSSVPVYSHFGVYAAVVEDACVLAVRKRRGPYTDWLDLPGGSLMANETMEMALDRELLEETGGDATQSGPWNPFEILVERNSSGQPIRFCHAGQWRRTALTGIRFDLPECEDVAGLEWVKLSSWAARNDLSPPLRLVLESLSERPHDPKNDSRQVSAY